MVLQLTAYILPGIVALVAVPMVLGKVPPNGFYGFRTPKTLSSAAIWYPANRFSGWMMIAAAALASGFNLTLWMARPDWPLETLVLWMSGSLVGSLLLGVAASLIYLGRL